MKHLNQNYDLSKVVNMLTIADDDELVGAIVKFKAVKYPAYEGLFRIGGRQRVWGYDANGKYTMIDGYRVFAIVDKGDRTHDFGLPCSLSELIIVSSNQ